MAKEASSIKLAENIASAAELCSLGARIQLVHEATNLPQARIAKIFFELHGKPASKGLHPYSTEWYLQFWNWLHGSLFLSIHRHFCARTTQDEGLAMIARSYRAYLNHISAQWDVAPLSINRAWFLLRFLDQGMMATKCCDQCHGEYLVRAYEVNEGYVCAICRPPSQAGAVRKAPFGRMAKK